MPNLMDVQGTCRQIPPAGDQVGWSRFAVWLGNRGAATRDHETGQVALTTAAGALVANPGDWVVCTHNGAVHLGRGVGA
jgi:hypothetical protein